MKRIVETIRNHRRQSALARLQKLCIRGTAGKKIPGLENISFQTWVELLGIYQMLAYGQPLPPMSKDARTVVAKCGL